VPCFFLKIYTARETPAVVRYINRSKQEFVQKTEKVESSKQTNYLSIYLSVQAEKRRKGNLIVMVHSVCLEQSLPNETTLPALESGCTYIKIVLFLCFQMSQALSMKISMKKGFPNWHLACRSDLLFILQPS
jgi:putative lipoic acid-binding regulatory protein